MLPIAMIPKAGMILIAVLAILACSGIFGSNQQVNTDRVPSQHGGGTQMKLSSRDMARIAAAIASAPTKEEIKMETCMSDLNEIDDNSDLVEGFERPHHGFPSGYFKIRSRVDGKAIEGSGFKVLINYRNDTPQQQWYVDSLGRLLNRVNNRVLTLHGDINVKLAPPSLKGRPEKQQWYLDKVGRIKNRYNELNVAFDHAARGDTGDMFLVKTNNGKEQRWYFERSEQPRQTITLVKDYDGADRHQRIPNSRLYPSNDWSYMGWVQVNSMTVGRGKWKHIFHKGDMEGKLRSPGVWIHPNKPKLHIRISTTKTTNEGCDPSFSVPMNKWFHLAIVLEGEKYYTYIDGKLSRTCRLKGTPNNNEHPIWIGNGKFAGNLHELSYSNFAMTEGELRQMMNKTEPVRQSKPAQPKRKPKLSSSLRAKEKVYQELLTKYLELKKKCETDNTKDKEINRLKSLLERSKLEIELVKAKKCPPRAKCLPLIQNQRTSSVNDFPIQEHKDFYKYVLASGVRKCPQPVSNKQLTEELKKCQGQFGLSQAGIGNGNFTPTVEMFTSTRRSHGARSKQDQLAAKAALAAKHATQAAEVANSVARDANNPYDVTKHKDFQKAVKSYLRKHPQQCKNTQFAGIDLNDQNAVKNALGKYMDKNKCGGLSPKDMSNYMLLTAHKAKMEAQRKALLTKYAFKDGSTCPPTFKPCPPDRSKLIKELRAQIAKMSKQIKSSNKDLNVVKKVQKAEKSNNQKKEISIKEHPDYKKLMQKYSWVDTKTCPPTFKPCTLLVDQLKKKIQVMQQLTAQLKQQLSVAQSNAKLPITKHPEYVAHIKKIREAASKACNLKLGKLRTGFQKRPITEHPDYATLQLRVQKQTQQVLQQRLKAERATIMKKYATRDNTTCPPRYIPCDANATKPIEQHPEIHKYVLKTQIPELMKMQPRDKPAPIQEHPQYQELRKKFLAACKAGKKPQQKCETHFL